MPPLHNARMKVRVEPELKTPLWFRLLMIAGVTGSLAITGLVIWGLIEIIPPLAGWLKRN